MQLTEAARKNPESVLEALQVVTRLLCKTAEKNRRKDPSAPTGRQIIAGENRDWIKELDSFGITV